MIFERQTSQNSLLAYRPGTGSRCGRRRAELHRLSHCSWHEQYKKGNGYTKFKLSRLIATYLPNYRCICLFLARKPS